jgi:DNA-binding NarL/FixJ family response regulator
MVDVVVAGSQPLVRFGLVQLFGRSPAVGRCLEASTRDEADALIEAHRPGLLVLGGEDIDAEGCYTWILETRRRWNAMPVLVWLPAARPRQIVELYRLGVRGMATGSAALDDLNEALARLTAGRSWYAPEIRPHLPPEAARNPSGPLPTLLPAVETPAVRDLESALSHRQLEIMALAGQGLRPRRIAEHLGISVRTVHAHREQIKARLGLASVEALDALAVRWLGARVAEQS